MSSTGRAEDSYRVGTKDAGPVCRFTGLGCPSGTDCRRCNIPLNSIGAKLLGVMGSAKFEQICEILDSAEVQAGEPEIRRHEAEQQEAI